MWRTEMQKDSLLIDKYRDKILNGPIGRTLFWLGLPLMVVQLVNVSYNVADTYWLSRYSEVAYAAPRQIWPFFMIVSAFTHGLSTANTAIISQAIGAREYEYARRIISYFASTMLLTGFSLSLLFLALGPYVYKYLMTTPQEIYGYTVEYSRVISLDLLLSSVYLSYSTVLQAIGDTRTPSRAGVLSSLLNIVLDPFFIFGVRAGDLVVIPSLGVAGAAWATVVSRFVGVLVILRVITGKYPFMIVRPSLSIERSWLLKSISIGAPVSLMMASNSLAFIFQNRLVNSFGAYVAAAAAIGFVLMDLADAALWGLTMAIATMVGQAIGAGLGRRARDVAKNSMLYIGASVFAGSMLILALRGHFISVFTSVPSIFNEADKFITYLAPTLALFAVFFVGMSVGRGSGHTLYPTLVGVFRLWVIRILVGYILAFKLAMGTTGLWLSMSLSNLFAGLLIVPWILRGGWTKRVT